MARGTDTGAGVDGDGRGVVDGVGQGAREGEVDGVASVAGMPDGATTRLPGGGGESTHECQPSRAATGSSDTTVTAAAATTTTGTANRLDRAGGWRCAVLESLSAPCIRARARSVVLTSASSWSNRWRSVRARRSSSVMSTPVTIAGVELVE